MSVPNGILLRLHKFLEAAAGKLLQAGAGAAAAEVTGIVSRLGELDADLYHVAEGAWDDVNAAQRRISLATSTSPAAGTRPSTAAPAPDYRPAAPPAPRRPDTPRSRSRSRSR